MAKKTETKKEVEPTNEPKLGLSELATALAQAIELTRPPVKKTVITRKKNTPWTPTDGSPRLKMRRKFFHHSLPLGNRVSNEEIALLNKIRPGTYCDGWVKVVRRKDKGLDIDYPVKTTSQRLKLVNAFGIRNFKELLERIVSEQSNPKQFVAPEDDLD
jgi:hypothetical protein